MINSEDIHELNKLSTELDFAFPDHELEEHQKVIKKRLYNLINICKVVLPLNTLIVDDVWSWPPPNTLVIILYEDDNTWKVALIELSDAVFDFSRGKDEVFPQIKGRAYWSLSLKAIETKKKELINSR